MFSIENLSNEDGNVNENVAKQWIKLQSTNHFNLHVALKTKPLNFHIHTASGKTKKKRTSYTNKKTENGKLKIQQPSLLTFPS